VSDEKKGHGDDEAIMWVASDRTYGNFYVATIHIGPDTSIPLETELGRRYALHIVRVASYALYDAALLCQFRAAGLEDEATAAWICNMREARPEPDNAATAPLLFTPMISMKGRAVVRVDLGDQSLGVYPAEVAMTHAMQVLEAVAVAELDCAYYTALTTGETPLEEGAAVATVSGLSAFRDTTSHTGRILELLRSASAPPTVVDRLAEGHYTNWESEIGVDLPLLCRHLAAVGRDDLVQRLKNEYGE